jgi:hypothetical protein
MPGMSPGVPVPGGAQPGPPSAPGAPSAPVAPVAASPSSAETPAHEPPPSGASSSGVSPEQPFANKPVRMGAERPPQTRQRAAAKRPSRDGGGGWLALVIAVLAVIAIGVGAWLALKM